MPRPAKNRQVAEDGGRSVPPSQEIYIQESADSSENVNIESASAQRAADNVNTGTASAHRAVDGTEDAQTSADEENLTQLGTEKQTPSLTKSELLKRIEVICADLNLTTKILDTLPTGLNGPIATIATELKRMNSNMDNLCDVMINMCSVKNNNTEVPPPGSYAEAIKRQGATVDSIQRLLREDARHNQFEKDKQLASSSFFIPDLKSILSKVDQDLATTGSTRVAKPTSEAVKSDLHWWCLSKAAAYVNDTLLKTILPTASQTFSKVIIRRNAGKLTSAIVECLNKDIKNTICRIIRCKIEGRTMRSNATPTTLPGVTADKHDFKTVGRVSDAKLQF